MAIRTDRVIYNPSPEVEELEKGVPPRQIRIVYWVPWRQATHKHKTA
jgi:hypothetical protein